MPIISRSTSGAGASSLGSAVPSGQSGESPFAIPVPVEMSGAIGAHAIGVLPLGVTHVVPRFGDSDARGSESRNAASRGGGSGIVAR
jgi:hypothetical protein